MVFSDILDQVHLSARSVASDLAAFRRHHASLDVGGVRQCLGPIANLAHFGGSSSACFWDGRCRE